MSKFQAIRTYFEADGGRKCSMEELKAVQAAGQTSELAQMCAKELGVTIDEPNKVAA